MSLQVTNNNGRAQDISTKQLEGLFLARSILTTNKLNEQGECVKIGELIPCELTMIKRVILPKEAMQMLSNWEALKEAFKVFTERKTAKALLLSHISEVPKFHEAKSESVKLSQSAKDPFTRIGKRARVAFIEEQIARAIFYNVPYENYGDNYYQLMVDIDRYEYLLEEAEKLGISWDDSIYDPIALEQAIEDHEESGRKERDYMYNEYLSSRRVAV